jgi:hypothetical protein
MWEDLLKFGEGAWESVSETAEVYVKSMAEAKAQDKVTRDQEARRDPDMLNQAEPQTATRTDGSTIVAPSHVQQATIVDGVSNTTLVIGGLLAVGLLFVLKD